MKFDITPILSPYIHAIWRRSDRWPAKAEELQEAQLRSLLAAAERTEIGRRYHFGEILRAADPYALFAERLPLVEYEDVREDIMRMLHGECDVLAPGRCRNFAQSSGTSGGKSKYIPITDQSLRGNHLWGARHAVGSYMRLNPKSRIFSGRSLILGGSFANELADLPKGVRAGDLSATLISSTPPFIELFRTPSKKIALMADWEEKLPRMAEDVAKRNVTNISGVPSWMLILMRKVLEIKGKNNLHEVWPNLEVFIHGGISFSPYAEQYRAITDPARMHYLETYNASEGFFAVQEEPADHAMTLIPDCAMFYEFIPLKGETAPVNYADVEVGKTYELAITGANGLWRYRLGDTVKVMGLNPVKIVVAGRTKTYINAFGEELMEHNAEHAIAEACRICQCSVHNYTAGPKFADDRHRGRHQWLIEWTKAPSNLEQFAKVLDEELQRVNSDYQAKRAHTIFLDPPEVITVPRGLFSQWLRTQGNGRLGGQRKVPRLSNDRRILDPILKELGR